jgi:hypothetical protein
VRLGDSWRRLEDELPDDWSDARLLLRVAEADQAERAASVLAPLMAGRSGNEIRFQVARHGAGPSTDGARRLLRRLDDERIRGELELVSSNRPEPVAEVERERLSEAWREAIAQLPPDWSDLHAEVELSSSDHLDRTALLLSPLNPTRYSDKPVLRFRVARRFGYGASPEMVARCLERMDDEELNGRLRILRVLSDTDPVATQGPVWYEEGRAV